MSRSLRTWESRASLSALMRLLLQLFLSVLVGGCAKERDSLTLFCAAGMRPSIEEATAVFEKETGTRVVIQFGGSGTLLSQLTMAKADLFVAADGYYIDLAEDRDLVRHRRPFATQKPVLVHRAAVEGVNSITDLLRDDIRVAVGDPEAAAIGRMSRAVLEEVGGGDSFRPTATFATVFELANALDLGTVDAAILWDNVAARYPELVIVPTPELSKYRSAIEVAVLRRARQPELAEAFSKFLVDSPEVRRILQEYGLSLPDS